MNHRGFVRSLQSLSFASIFDFSVLDCARRNSRAGVVRWLGRAKIKEVSQTCAKTDQTLPWEKNGAGARRCERAAVEE